MNPVDVTVLDCGRKGFLRMFSSLPCTVAPNHEMLRVPAMRSIPLLNGALPGALLGLSFVSEFIAPAFAGVDNPTPENFLRRPYPDAVVIGDYVYIDGGELSQLEDGFYDGNHPSYVVNTTLSLPLNEAWTNASVTLRSIEKSAPLQEQQVLWADPSTSSFYTWGGQTPWFGLPAENEIWKFTADGSGGGSWSQVSPSNIVAFTSSIRTLGSAYTTVKGVGYSIGGTANKYVDTSVSDDSIAVQGIVTLDMGSLAWNNASSSGLGVNGTSMNARLEYVPFGSSGFLVLLGGAALPVGVIDEYEQLDWNSVWVMDLATNKWYNQATTGSKPTKRERHCSVGVQGPNGTYEIFIYGGASSQTLSTSPDVYVLSLPGFVMFKSPNPGVPRQDFACVTVGRNSSSTSNRQMLAVGGSNGWLGFPKSLTDPDPWKQGLGIFDLTEMTWSSAYDPDAAAYQSPDVVNTWYSQGGLNSVDWANDVLKTLFVGGTNSSSTNNGNGTTTSGSSGSSSSDTGTSSNNSSDSGSSNHTGAVVGGVVGGVAGLAIIALIAWLVMRRRRKNRSTFASAAQELPVDARGNYYPQEYYHTGENKPEMWQQPPEMSADQTPTEMEAQHNMHHTLHELPDQSAYSQHGSDRNAGAYDQSHGQHYSSAQNYSSGMATEAPRT